MVTTVYLDVDGVINAVTDQPPREATCWMGDWTGPVKVAGMPILYAEELITELNGIAARENVTVKWLTSWEEEAAHDLAPAIGLNGTEWEVLSGVEFDDPMNWNWWKLDRIRADIKATRPDKVIWLDDDIAFDPKTITWLLSPGLPLLPLSPRVTHGLTRNDLQLIRNFLDSE